MGIEVAIAAVGLAFSAKSAIDQKKEQKKQRKAQKGAAAEQQKQKRSEFVRQRRRQAREERIARAASVNTAAAKGIQGSSVQAGAVSSGLAQLGTNVGFLNQSEQRGINTNAFAQQAADAGLAQQNAAQLGQLGGSIFSNSAKLSGGISSIGGTASSIFSPKPFVSGRPDSVR